MFRLSREVRFSPNPTDKPQLQKSPSNSFAGFPTQTEIAPYLSLEVTLAGHPDATSGCLLNIKDIDAAVRQKAIPLAMDFAQQKKSPEKMLRNIFDLLKPAWPGIILERLRLSLNPYLSLMLDSKEPSMVRLSQKFEFCASHRLHNSALGDEENRRLFGKCNNPHGHGHNYILEVSLTGQPDENGLLQNLPDFERIVATTVVDRLDHKNFNVEIPEFKELIPTVENIAMVIFKLLKPKFQSQPKLAGVTVWETSKTWCEYAE
jgi:6-pyruvoyltetrahydropterin/6-carboxytetrahydropterin synthase